MGTVFKSYPRLIQAAEGYWKKYADKNDINAYIKIFTLFDLSFFKQLDQLLPSRADTITGVLIQPNVLERSKDTILPKLKQYDSSYYALIDQTSPSASGDYLQYLGGIDGNILSISAQDDDQWQMYLTASQAKKYDGTTYSYEYLIRSGSTYITASTPYWRSEAVCPAITSSVLSQIKLLKQSKYIIDVDVATTDVYTSSIYDNGIDGIGAFITKNADSNSLTIDDITLSIGSKILIKNGIKASPYGVTIDVANGIYEVTDFGDGISTYPTLTRLQNADQSYDFYPQYVRVSYGSVNANSIFYQSNPFFAIIGSDVPTYDLISETIFSYIPAEVQDYLPTGIDNQRYSGAKLTSPGFNVNSTQTIDGGPVVEWRTANPNQLIYQNNGEQGSFVLV